jgi:hypothetical protein
MTETRLDSGSPPRRSPGHRGGVEPVETDQHRQETRGVDEEAGGGPERGVDEPRERGPHHPGEVEGRAVERDRAHQVVLPDHLDQVGLTNRNFERAHQAGEQRQGIDPRHGDQPQQGEHADGHGLDQKEGLEAHQPTPLVDPIGDHAPVEGEEQHRQRPERGDQSRLQGRVGQLEH